MLIVQWIRLRLPSCGPGFESQAHHPCIFQFIWFKFKMNFIAKRKRTKISKKAHVSNIKKSAAKTQRQLHCIHVANYKFQIAILQRIEAKDIERGI